MDNLIQKFAKYRQAQPIKELERKARKADRRKQKIWTQEEVDWAHAKAKMRIVWLNAE